MSFEEFRQAIASGTPPDGVAGSVLALWHDARGDWHAAHAAAQTDASANGAWVHAYLHRKEGDPGNAGYWYARARQPIPAENVTLDAEWAQIAQALLEKT